MLVEGSVLVADSELKDVIDDVGGEGGKGNEGCSKGEEKGKNVSTAEQHFPEDPGLWPEKLADHQRDTIVCRLASKCAEKNPT